MVRMAVESSKFITEFRKSKPVTATSSQDTPVFNIQTQEVEYASHDGQHLLARFHVPHGEGPFPLVAEIHGGAWCRGDRLDEDRFNQMLARRGFVVAALDFRMPPQASYPASLADINYAIRWLKANAHEWKSRGDLVGMMGLSSGAHLATLCGMRPDDARYSELPLDNNGLPVDASAAFVIACWPVIDPLGRYHYALEWKASGRPYPEAIERVIPDHVKYWVNEDAMSEGSPLRILERGDRVKTPPLLFLQGESDLVHPRAHADRFLAAYRKAGGQVESQWFPGQDAGFVNKQPDSPSTAQALDTIVGFINGVAN
ncbi:MAG: alpha/beta hydrolase [Comamonadaceae bacterium]|nr:MAG: alpha/beta hydrolase [Comamonadaceae bacterium]